MRIIRSRAWIRMKQPLWSELITELGWRAGGQREAGAFLLGERPRRRVQALAFYDDLDVDSLNGGVAFEFAGYTELARRCDETGLQVLADVHTHGGNDVAQSRIDRDNPMVARRGHVALIVPQLAGRPLDSNEVGVHRYLGDDGWDSRSGRAATRALYIGRWA